jgi:hypothetical protein
MCSTVTKARKKGAGIGGEIYFVKKITEMWSADNEIIGLRKAGNHPGVVKCHKIFDRRACDSDDQSVHFVL